MPARIVALGQRAAGDDAVGLAVLDALRRAALPPGTELVEAAEATALVDLLVTDRPVVVVDAVVGPGRIGEVLALDAGALATSTDRPVSTHGVDVAQALALARVLSPETAARSIAIVAVRIAPPARFTHGLSDAVAAAVPRAVSTVLACLGGA